MTDRDPFESEEVTFGQVARRFARYEDIHLEDAPWLTDILDEIGEAYAEPIEKYRPVLDREMTQLRRLVDENALDLFDPAVARALLLGLLFSTNFLVNVTGPADNDGEALWPVEQMRILCYDLREYAQA
ncbi:MAG: hypothetical protein KJN71_09360 [Acidimicrobiia bacterium]|nr:hypothetical protein [Acidimicrobiia bacterium]